jgi:hypothetical protein
MLALVCKECRRKLSLYCVPRDDPELRGLYGPGWRGSWPSFGK